MMAKPENLSNCAAQKSLIPTLAANTEATILKEGWRSCAWQVPRQVPGSEFCRALASGPMMPAEVTARNSAGRIARLHCTEPATSWLWIS
jgi:hypothetical protein